MDLRDYFYYDPSSHTYLRHSFDKAKNVNRDDPAGHYHSEGGYLRVKVDNEHFISTRVVWAIVRNKGVLPPAGLFVVPIDGDRYNLSITNLLLVNRSEMKLLHNYWNNITNVTELQKGWVATLQKERIGLYPTKEKAIEAYKAALLHKVNQIVQRGMNAV